MPCVATTLQYVNYLSWKRRLMMLHDVASGMMFMHSRRYVHGDLRSPNLFITENGRVSDDVFGSFHSGDVLRRLCAFPRQFAAECRPRQAQHLFMAASDRVNLTECLGVVMQPGHCLERMGTPLCAPPPTPKAWVTSKLQTCNICKHAP